MSRRRSITSAVFAAAASSILLLQTLPTRADDWANCPIQTGGPPAGQQAPSCSLTDIGNALQNTYNGFTNGQCAAACDDPVTCALAVWATVLVGSMGGQSQGFLQCRQPGEQLDRRRRFGHPNRKELAQSGWGLPSPRSSKSSVNTLGSTVADIASVETPFTCACSIAAGLGQTFNDLGACVESALCALADWASNLTGGWISSCTTNVSIDWGNCNQLGCAPAGSDGCPIICNSAKTVCFQPCGEVVGACSCPPADGARHGGAGQSGRGRSFRPCPALPEGTGTHAPPSSSGVVNLFRLRQHRAGRADADQSDRHVSAAADRPALSQRPDQLRGNLPGDLRGGNCTARQRPVLCAPRRPRPAVSVVPPARRLTRAPAAVARPFSPSSVAPHPRSRT